MAFDEKRIIALDSITIRRGWETPSGKKGFFQGLLGASLSVYEAKDFVGQYQSILEELFTRYSLPKEKLSYKAAEIYTLLTTKPRAADAFVHEFAKAVLEIEGPKLNIFVGTFDIQALVQEQAEMAGAASIDVLTDVSTHKVVPIYGESSGTQMVTVPELIERISNPLPAICAWKLTKVTGIFNQQFLLDHFEGEESKAWRDLISNNQVYLIPKGSACNPYISAIDIFLRSVNRILERRRLRLSPPNVRDALTVIAKGFDKSDAHVHHVSNDDIDMIRPITPRQIPTDAFVKHPIFFIFNEQDVRGEREEIETSPLMRKLHDLAYEKLGGVLFYKPDVSTKFMQAGDFFVAYGPKGTETYKRLKKLGYDLNYMEMK